MIEEIKTIKAPGSIAPYSQGIKAGDYIFVSGQIALDPETGKLVKGGIKEQTEQVIKNIEAVLGGHPDYQISLENVVKVEIYLKDLKNDFDPMNKVYGERFVSDPKPARQAVGVAELPGPDGVLIEMSVIAYHERIKRMD